LAKVKCIKEVSLGSLGQSFVVGEEYNIPAKEAKAYPEYFELMETKTETKKEETEENK
tara:strand:+ start:592 stop:765 length:174 start_codon:yes stop_codon:yes gene_type:complete